MWDKGLKDIFDKLVCDKRTRVRRTIAFSLIEISKILGPELTEF